MLQHCGMIVLLLPSFLLDSCTVFKINYTIIILLIFLMEDLVVIHSSIYRLIDNTAI